MTLSNIVTPLTKIIESKFWLINNERREEPPCVHQSNFLWSGDNYSSIKRNSLCQRNMCISSSWVKFVKKEKERKEKEGWREDRDLEGDQQLRYLNIPNPPRFKNDFSEMRKLEFPIFFLDHFSLLN